MTDEISERPSKSAAKRAADLIRAQAQALIDIYATGHDRIDLDETLHHELALAQRLKKGAARRQLQRIAQLLRERPEVCAEIEAIQADISRTSLDARQRFRQTERRRAALISNDANARAEVRELATESQWQQICQWLELYETSFDERRQKHAFRSLFQCLNDLDNSKPDTPSSDAVE